MAADLEYAHEKKQAISVQDDHVQETSDQSPIEQETKDNVVDWDGPDDLQNPRNWPAWKRLTQVIIASAFLLTA